MNVGDDGAGGVLNRASNHTRGGLRERKRRPRKKQGHTENQVFLHALAPQSAPVCRCIASVKFRAAIPSRRSGWSSTASARILTASWLMVLTAG